MKNILKILFFIIPFFGYGQTCDIDTNITNADSIEYCITNSSCHASCDGEITITVYGPNQPYYFEWGSGTPIANDNSRDSLCAGNYSVTITDNAGNLVDFQSNEIEEPSELGIFRTLNHPSCYNYSDGSINVTTLGDSPFSWSWNNGFNTEDISNLQNGEYILTTIDSNNCFRIDTFNLVDPVEVSSITITDTLSCIGLCDASGIIIPQNGIFPFSFLWDDSQITDTAVNLCYGINNVTITDANGCFNTNFVEIANPDTLQLSSIVTDSACYQICDGAISVSIEGGTSPYNVSWTINSLVFDTLNTSISSLCPDMYTLNFSDENGCTETENIILYERDSFILQSTIINDSCYNSCSGQIEVNILNPENSPFIYNWSNGVNTSNINSNLCADTFNLELIDTRLCRDTFEFIITEPLALSFDSVYVVNNTCYNDGTGSIAVNISGGTGTISTLWSGLNNFSSMDEDISNLNAGTYTLHVEDDYLCTKDTIFSIIQPDSLFATFSVQNVSCYNYSDGVIDLLIHGRIDTSLITTSWDVVLSDSTVIDSLTAGNYIYIVSDTNGCYFTDTVIVTQPDSLIISDTITNVLCNGYHTGSIDLTIIGGTAAYTYSWDNSSTSEDLSGLSAGTYIVMVTDTKGCTENGTYSLTEPLFPISSNIDSINVLCNGGNTGSAELTVNGGTSSYSYLWSNADTTEDIDSLIAGTYTVIIKDVNDCFHFDTTTIIESAIISTLINIDSVLCNGDSTGVINIINTTGGTLPYIYSINGFTYSSPPPVLVTAGQYNLTVTDINSCAETLSLNVYQPSELTSSLSNTNITCYGYNDGSVNLTPFGGVGNYIFNWSNNESTEDINNLSPGNYFIELIDGNGCLDSGSVTITEPSELIIINTIITHPLCNGYETGSIDITCNGGTGGLSYNWSNGSTTPFINNLASNTYTVSVLDANDCPLNESFIITEPLAYLPYFNVNNVMCFGDFTGSIDFTITGNTPQYTYVWSNGANTQDLEYLSSGTYSVTVEDQNNCIESFDITVIQPEELILGYSVYHATCEENDDGSITTNVSGGTIPYAYFWSNGLYDSDLYNLSKGLYTLEIRDANSCVYPTQTIEVGFEGYDGCLEIPSGFTPNNDGIHDEWAIYGLYNFPDVVVSVHNRWGQKVFFSEGYNIPWDGKNNGVDLPIATYYYVIELKDSEKVFNGTVTIKR